MMDLRRVEKIRAHFTPTSACTIHTFDNPASTPWITRALARLASDSRYDFTLLDGTHVDNAEKLLTQLATLYRFPKPSEASYAGLGWDGALDWLADLTWITGLPVGSGGVEGFILQFLEPMVLFSRDLLTFANFLDLVGVASQQHRKDGADFHLVLGPLRHPAHAFINMLRVSEQTCHEKNWLPDESGPR
jgi:hypothetical protein